MIKIFFLVAALLLVGGAARAQTYSLAGDWNFTTDSASNLWAYGTSSGPFNGTNFIVPVSTHQSGTTLQFWNLASGTDPNIGKNVTSSDIVSSSADFRAGKVSFGPFQGPAIAQFTAPSSGLYNLSVTFQTDQSRDTADNTAGFVYVGGMLETNHVFNTPINTQFGTPYTFPLNNLFLTASETVDFGVGGGAFTTQVDATLMAIPEPTTWVLMLGGLACIGSALRRRQILL